MGLKSWITTGDLYSKDFAYGEVPWKLDVFDTETFARSPMKFTVVCTDIETGKPCYQESDLRYHRPDTFFHSALPVWQPVAGKLMRASIPHPVCLPFCIPDNRVFLFPPVQFLDVIISPARLDEPFVIIPDSARINDIWD